MRLIDLCLAQLQVLPSYLRIMYCSEPGTMTTPSQHVLEVRVRITNLSFINPMLSFFRRQGIPNAVLSPLVEVKAGDQ